MPDNFLFFAESISLTPDCFGGYVFRNVYGGIERYHASARALDVDAHRIIQPVAVGERHL